jgi:hypothetical protein
MFSFDLASLQRLAVSAVGALLVSTALLAATVGPVPLT